MKGVAVLLLARWHVVSASFICRSTHNQAVHLGVGSVRRVKSRLCSESGQPSALDFCDHRVHARTSKAGGNRNRKYDEERASAESFLEKDEISNTFGTANYAEHKGMQLVFLGTSSSIPTLARNTSCIALRLEGTVFLFDCGEGSLRQILQTPLKHCGIKTIFITHMHGDHIYGLPGLLCRIGLKEFERRHPVQIFGPQGIRQWIRSNLKASHARVHSKYSVHELILKEKPANRCSWNLIEENHEDELSGEDIYCSKDDLWHLYRDDRYTVRASLLRHSIPCWGYVVEEQTRQGRFNLDRALECGVKPGPHFSRLQSGNEVTLPSGKVVMPSDVLGPPRRGRKVVILGDTCDSRTLADAARDADVLVHEATVLQADASEALKRGHSTAEMAGLFAKAVNACTLVLTHFSRKLDGAVYVSKDSRIQETVGHLVSAAQKSFGKSSVIAAQDFMAITIQLKDAPVLENVQCGQVHDTVP